METTQEAKFWERAEKKLLFHSEVKCANAQLKNASNVLQQAVVALCTAQEQINSKLMDAAQKNEIRATLDDLQAVRESVDDVRHKVHLAFLDKEKYIGEAIF